jgi:biopolymer transport protein ExbD
MARYRYKRQTLDDGEPLVNLTPLIDVVFVILIAFIVIAPLLERELVELAEASTAAQGESVATSSPISIHVSNDDIISLNGQHIAEADLIGALMQAKAVHPEISPQLFHDKNGRFGTYQRVKNAAQMAGFSTIEVVLEPQ